MISEAEKNNLKKMYKDYCNSGDYQKAHMVAETLAALEKKEAYQNWANGPAIKPKVQTISLPGGMKIALDPYCPPGTVYFYNDAMMQMFYRLQKGYGGPDDWTITQVTKQQLIENTKYSSVSFDEVPVAQPTQAVKFADPEDPLPTQPPAFSTLYKPNKKKLWENDPKWFEAAEPQSMSGGRLIKPVKFTGYTGLVKFGKWKLKTCGYCELEVREQDKQPNTFGTYHRECWLIAKKAPWGSV